MHCTPVKVKDIFKFDKKPNLIYNKSEVLTLKMTLNEVSYAFGSLILIAPGVSPYLYIQEFHIVLIELALSRLIEKSDLESSEILFCSSNFQ